MAQIQVRIDVNSIHHYIDVPIFDENDLPTGQTKEVLRVSFRCPEYPRLPTYGIDVDMPATQQQVKDAITAKVQLVKNQITRDSILRDLLGADILNFTVEVN